MASTTLPKGGACTFWAEGRTGGTGRGEKDFPTKGGLGLIMNQTAPVTGVGQGSASQREDHEDLTDD